MDVLCSPHNFQQLKGLWEGAVLLDGEPLLDWEHIALELEPAWLAGLQGWRQYSRPDQVTRTTCPVVTVVAGADWAAPPAGPTSGGGE